MASTEPRDLPPDPRVRLAIDRTFYALERTQMAWVRTSLAAISFGFAIAQFSQYLLEHYPGRAPLLSPTHMGMFLIIVGVGVLILAGVQHRQELRRLREYRPDLPRSIARIMSVVIMALGVLVFVGLLLRH